MQAIFYKKFFEVRLFHQLAPTKICTAFQLQPTKECTVILNNYKMQWRSTAGKLIVFYSGALVQEGLPPNKKIIPFPAIVPNGTAFLFTVNLLDHTIINTTTVPPAIAVTDAAIAIPNSFVKPAVVSLRLPKTANTKLYENFKVLNADEKLIYEVLIKQDEGGFYPCSADLTLSPPGIYSFTFENDNSVLQKFYVDTPGEISGKYGFFKIVKDGAWLLPDKIRPAPPLPDHNIFNYIFPSI